MPPVTTLARVATRCRRWDERRSDLPLHRWERFAHFGSTPGVPCPPPLLVGGKVRVLPLDDLVRQPSSGDDAVAVTFDDGFLNVRNPIVDLLGDGLPVTIFAVTERVGQANDWGGHAAPGIPTLPLLGWDQLEDLVSRGAAVAAHTRTHPSLPSVSRQELDDELLGAREDLRHRLGATLAHLAYPYGDVDDRVAARAGEFFRWGHTTEFRPLAPSDSPLRLPRLDMFYFRAPGALDAWGTPRFRRRVTWLRARRRIRATLLGRGPRATHRSTAT